MNRRAFVFAAACVAALTGIAAAKPHLKVVYVGGSDCPPCTRWKNTRKAAWLASPEHRQVEWIEVEAPRLKEAYQERYWPDSLKPILARLPHKGVTPRFLIVEDGRLAANEQGVSGWTKVMAHLGKLLGE